MPKRRIPSVFLFKFNFFQVFIGIFYLKMYKFLICQFKCISYENSLSISKFVKVLDHFPAQVLPNKKTAALCVFCVRSYSSNNLLSFDANALYFVRPLYIPRIGLPILLEPNKQTDPRNI
jgi:hypothetical protein